MTLGVRSNSLPHSVTGFVPLKKTILHPHLYFKRSKQRRASHNGPRQRAEHQAPERATQASEGGAHPALASGPYRAWMINDIKYHHREEWNVVSALRHPLHPQEEPIANDGSRRRARTMHGGSPITPHRPRLLTLDLHAYNCHHRSDQVSHVTHCLV